MNCRMSKHYYYYIIINSSFTELDRSRFHISVKLEKALIYSCNLVFVLKAISVLQAQRDQTVQLANEALTNHNLGNCSLFDVILEMGNSKVDVSTSNELKFHSPNRNLKSCLLTLFDKYINNLVRRWKLKRKEQI